MGCILQSLQYFTVSMLQLIFATATSPLCIVYDFYDTSLGKTLIASSENKICYVGFTDKYEELYNSFSRLNVQVEFIQAKDAIHVQACASLLSDVAPPEFVCFASGFEQEILTCLLKIPRGKTISYGDIAKSIGRPYAARAIGTAVGKNRISYFIPCHRVIKSDGTMGEYHWGKDIKKRLLQEEGAHAVV